MWVGNAHYHGNLYTFVLSSPTTVTRPIVESIIRVIGATDTVINSTIHRQNIPDLNLPTDTHHLCFLSTQRSEPKDSHEFHIQENGGRFFVSWEAHQTGKGDQSSPLTMGSGRSRQGGGSGYMEPPKRFIRADPPIFYCSICGQNPPDGRSCKCGYRIRGC